MDRDEQPSTSIPRDVQDSNRFWQSASAVGSRYLEPHGLGRGPQDRAQSSETDNIQSIITYRRLFQRINLPVETPPSSRRPLGERVLASSVQRSRISESATRSARAEAAAAPDHGDAGADEQPSTSIPRDSDRFWQSASAVRSRDLEPHGLGRGPQDRAQSSETDNIQSIITYRRLFQRFNLQTPPSSRRPLGERVLASSVQRSRISESATRSARAEAAAAPDHGDAGAGPNTSIESADVVSLDTIDEIEEPNENHPQNQNGATNENMLNVNGSTAASSQRHGVKRRRDGDDGYYVPSTLSEFNQALLRMFECPVCLELIEPPMPQCMRGHLVCSVCRARLSSCPLCRSAFSPMRNTAMEGVADMLRYPCRRGCGRGVPLRLRSRHEAGCAARLYPCPAPTCAGRPRLAHDHLLLHFQDEHGSMLLVGSRHTFTVNVELERREHWLVWAYGEPFHVRVAVNVRFSDVLVHAGCIGPRGDDRRYTYRVAMEGLSERRVLEYTSAVHSNLASYTYNLILKDCFHQSPDHALNFIRIEDERRDQAGTGQAELFKFTLEIIKLGGCTGVNPPSDS